MKTINIKLIRIDGGTQSRAEIDTEAVAEYAQAIKDGATFPPVVVFLDGTDHWLADGFHRYHAHNAAEKASIDAEIRPGTLRDAILYSLGVNGSHGIRPSNADKRKAVLTMLQDAEWAAWSDSAIAKQCSVSQPFVGVARKSLITVISGDPEAARTYINKDGTKAKMKAGKIGKSGGIIAEPTAPATPATAVALTAEQVKAADEQEQLTVDAHGGTTLAEEIDKLVAENLDLQGQIAAAQADDLKAEAMKWKRIADVGTRRQNELMTTVNEREKELKRHMNTIRRIGKAVGEADPYKVAVAVEAFVRSVKVRAPDAGPAASIAAGVPQGQPRQSQTSRQGPAAPRGAIATTNAFPDSASEPADLDDQFSEFGDGFDPTIVDDDSDSLTIGQHEYDSVGKIDYSEEF